MVSIFRLWLELKRLGILRTARVNCLAGFHIVSEKDLKKRNHGSSSYFPENGHNDSGIMILRWSGNRCVQVVYTCCCPKRTSIFKRWHGAKKTDVDVSYPEVVKSAILQCVVSV